jgi:hypothetical protein
MANKLQMQHERRKLQLRGVVLQGRATVAATQEKIKRAREELKSMSPKKSATGGSFGGGIPSVKIR